MRSKIAVIALGIVVVASAFGASAFTTGTVDRAATVNVQGDSSGLIGLEAGTTDFVTGGTGSQLAIDVTGQNNAGVNQEATFQIGDQASPAFNITNNFNTDQTFVAQYNMTATDSAGTIENIQFQVFDSTGANVATVTEQNASETSLGTLTPGQSYGVVIDIDTSNLTSSDDLSGSLRVTA